MTNSGQSDHLQEAVSELQAINSLIERICGVRETNHIMSIIINELVRLTEADQGVINLISSDEQSKGRTIVRTKLHDPDEIPFHASEQISGWVLRNQTVLLIKDMKSDVRFRDLSLDSDEFTSLICAPMIVRGDVVGITSLVRQDERGSFNENHVRLAGIISSQSAQILSNALLLEELAKNNELLEESHRQLEKENVRLADVISAGFSFEGIIGHSRAIRQVLTLASKVCGNDSPVLIMGATGTGKDLIARAIHYSSRRRKGPFVIKNCGVKTETLLESELFGHVKGAFTGADRTKPGLFSEADGGTIFLDEIGDAPMSTQTAILRVIENGEVRPVGASKSEFVNVRVISATNRDLKKAIELKEFRSDLFYRINAVTINVPPLTERLDDIPLLVEHFLKKQRIGMQNENLSITAEALAVLQKYSWPGNVRQLANEIERASLLCEVQGLIDVTDLSEEVTLGAGTSVSSAAAGQLRSAVEKLEQEMIVRTLKETKGNIQKSSRFLGLSRKGLKDKMNRYGLSVQDDD